MIEISEILIFLAVVMYTKAVFLAIYIYTKHEHLTKWLKDQAPMTWETYKRLGNIKKCNQNCVQGRECKCKKN
jgi:hypothetical protein